MEALQSAQGASLGHMPSSMTPPSNRHIASSPTNSNRSSTPLHEQPLNQNLSDPALLANLAELLQNASRGGGPEPSPSQEPANENPLKRKQPTPTEPNDAANSNAHCDETRKRIKVEPTSSHFGQVATQAPVAPMAPIPLDDLQDISALTEQNTQQGPRRESPPREAQSRTQPTIPPLSPFEPTPISAAPFGGADLFSSQDPPDLDPALLRMLCCQIDSIESRKPPAQTMPVAGSPASRSSPETGSFREHATPEGHLQFSEPSHDAIAEGIFQSLHNDADLILVEVKKYAEDSELSSTTYPRQHSASFLRLCGLIHETRTAVDGGKGYLRAHQFDFACPAVIEDVNMALFCASAYQANPAVETLEALYDNFLAVFAINECALPMKLGQLFLDIGTELYLTKLAESQDTLSQKPALPDEVLLNRLLGDGLQMAVQTRRLGADLSSEEQALLAVAEARCRKLRELAPFHTLRTDFPFSNFLSRVGQYVKDKDDIRPCSLSPEPNIAPVDYGMDPTLYQQLQAAASNFESSNPNLTAAGGACSAEGNGNASDATNIASIFAALSNNIDNPEETHVSGATAQAQPPSQFTPSSQISHIQQPAITLPQTPTNNAASAPPAQYAYPQEARHGQTLPQTTFYPLIPGADEPSLPPGQSKPTLELYAEARRAAANKTNGTNREHNGSRGARRPWSREEEAALMSGLDHVKGPHWSAILSLYGENGSASNVLGRRSQVQLKDKARNLKLFFLKHNVQLPEYLKAVTGELKTRAPSQHAKRQAEMARSQQVADDQAKFEGITALNHLQRSSATMPHVSNSGAQVAHVVTAPAALPVPQMIPQPLPKHTAQATTPPKQTAPRGPAAAALPTSLPSLGGQGADLPSLRRLNESYSTPYRSTITEFAPSTPQRATTSPASAHTTGSSLANTGPFSVPSTPASAVAPTAAPPVTPVQGVDNMHMGLSMDELGEVERNLIAALGGGVS